jgi:endonuclease/exonuclease/phosphatase (EEP) superfamily protein YafD
MVLGRALGWAYPLELLTHFQVQYFLAALACGGTLLVLRRRRLALCAAAAAAVSGGALWPYLLGDVSSAAHAADEPPEARLRVMHANVLWSNAQHDRLLDAIHGAEPDVVVLQEINSRWMRAIAPELAEYRFCASGVAEDRSGIAIFSRHPLCNVRISPPGDPGAPCITAAVLLGPRVVSLATIHPRTPLTPRGHARRNDQLREVARRAAELPRPLVLVGDLNTTMWSPHFTRLLEDLHLNDARRGFGLRPSWPTFLPPPARIPIDHCLVSPEVSVTDCRLGPSFGSDHLPLIVDLSLP